MTSRTLLLVSLAGLLAGCAPPETNLSTYWGPGETTAGETRLAAGRGLATRGLVTRLITDSDPSLDLVEVVLAEAETPVTCAMYRSWMEDVAAMQSYSAEVLALPPEQRPADWQSYVCQELNGAARDTFGGDGRYRALHALLNATGGGPEGDLFRPASPGDSGGSFLGGNLVASQRDRYVARLYERSRHAEGILPSDADTSWQAMDISPIDGCGGIISVLAEELDQGRTTYPDRESIALQAATHRWYHHPDDRTSVGLGGTGTLPVGITFAGWQGAATLGGRLSVTVFTGVSRAPDTFPYDYVLLTTKGAQVEVEACTALNDYTALVWPEITQLGAPPLRVGGDDDDSAG